MDERSSRGEGVRIAVIPARRPVHLPARPLQAESGRASERGQALAEFALVVGIMLVLALAVFDLGRAFYNGLLLTQAARDGARVAMDCSATVGQIESAALAAAPDGTNVVVSPDPRPACPASNSSDTQTTVTATYTYQWITWGGSTPISQSAVSR